MDQMVPLKREGRETVQFTLRLPATLHDTLTREADGAGVTLTALIVRRLERSQDEAKAERQWRSAFEAAREARDELFRIRGEISEINVMISHLEPMHSMVLALASAQGKLNPLSGYVRSMRRHSAKEIELEKTRDKVRRALDMGVAHISGRRDEAARRDLEAPSIRVVSRSPQTKTPDDQ